MRQFIYFVSVLICIAFSSCEEQPLGPNGITGFREVYHYENSDSIVSADSHEFTLSMTGDNQPKDWTAWDLDMWSGDEVPDIINEHLEGWESPFREEIIVNGSSVGLDWITFDKQLTSTSPKLHITVKKNDTGKVRGVMLLYGNENESGGPVDCGFIFIFQNDMGSQLLQLRGQ